MFELASKSRKCDVLASPEKKFQLVSPLLATHLLNYTNLPLIQAMPTPSVWDDVGYLNIKRLYKN